MSNYVEILTEELRQHGVTEWRVEADHKHPQLHFVWHDRPLMFVMPKTPSDRRGHLNALSDLRKIMGVKRVIVKSTTPPKKRNRIETPLTKLETFAARANPFAILSGVKDEAIRLINQARWDGQAAFHAGLCGVPPVSYAPHLADAYLTGWWAGHRRGC